MSSLDSNDLKLFKETLDLTNQIKDDELFELRNVKYKYENLKKQFNEMKLKYEICQKNENETSNNEKQIEQSDQLKKEIESEFLKMTQQFQALCSALVKKEADDLKDRLEQVSKELKDNIKEQIKTILEKLKENDDQKKRDQECEDQMKEKDNKIKDLSEQNSTFVEYKTLYNKCQNQE